MKFIKRETVNFCIVIAIYLIGSVIINHLAISNYLQWIFAGVIIGILAIVICLGANLIFYRDLCVLTLKKLHIVRS